MNEDNLFDSLRIWYEYRNDVMYDGKSGTVDRKTLTALAQSIISTMFEERAEICRKLGLETGNQTKEILERIEQIIASSK